MGGSNIFWDTEHQEKAKIWERNQELNFDALGLGIIENIRDVK